MLYQLQYLNTLPDVFCTVPGVNQISLMLYSIIVHENYRPHPPKQLREPSRLSQDVPSKPQSCSLYLIILPLKTRHQDRFVHLNDFPSSVDFAYSRFQLSLLRCPTLAARQICFQFNHCRIQKLQHRRSHTDHLRYQRRSWCGDT